MERSRRILVAPLDWGLGHATRCIPIIKALLQHNAQVIIAGSGNSAALLKAEFPALKHYALPAYNPRYPANGNMVSGMAMQLPRFMAVIYQEYARLQQIVKDEKVDVVISDNRYGCHTLAAKSIFITHQLNILMPPAFKWMQRYVNHFNLKQVAKFDECWVPAPGNELLGDLLPAIMPANTRFTGYLSRFKKQATGNKYRVAVIASGPEPQRTMLVELLQKQLKESNTKAFLVRGEFDGQETVKVFDNYTEANYLGSEKLNDLMAQSDIIVARSGYSTIMDVAKLGKKAIFIPTPGQTEQEYLAVRLTEHGIAFSMEQKAFNLKTAIKEADKFSGFTNFGYHDTLLDQAIESIL